MAKTTVRGLQITDATVQRADLDTSTVGQAVVAKIIQGTSISLSSTGGDSGTGDVTVSVDSTVAILTGKASPQTFAFGTASGASTGYLTSTAHATKGKYFLNSAGTITVDEVNVRLGIGTASPGVALEVTNGTNSLKFDPATTVLTLSGPASTLAQMPRLSLALNGDANPAVSFLTYAHDNLALTFDSYHNGSAWVSSHAGSNFSLYKSSSEWIIGYNAGTTAGSTFTFNLTNGVRFSATGKLGVGKAATAKVDIAAGSATAGTAPFKLTSGPVLTVAEVGAMEFLTDALYFTITTGAARRTVGFLESAQTWTATQTFTTPVLGTPTSGTLTNCTGLPTAGHLDDSVTYAKIQNISATSRILGRKTAAAGDTEECTLSEILDFVGSAAQGDILYRGASTWARLAAGTSGQVLQTLGAGANPQWATAGGGGTKTYASFSAIDAQPPATNYATFDTRNSIGVLEFDTTTEESVFFVGVVPEAASLGSGLMVKLHWMADTATTGDCRWGVQFEKMNTTDEDADSYDTAVEATTTTDATSGKIKTTSLTVTTIDSLVAGDPYRLKVYRDVTDAADTMAGDAQLVAVEIRSAA